MVIAEKICLQIMMKENKAELLIVVLEFDQEYFGAQDQVFAYVLTFQTYVYILYMA